MKTSIFKDKLFWIATGTLGLFVVLAESCHAQWGGNYTLPHDHSNISKGGSTVAPVTLDVSGNATVGGTYLDIETGELRVNTITDSGTNAVHICAEPDCSLIGLDSTTVEIPTGRLELFGDGGINQGHLLISNNLPVFLMHNESSTSGERRWGHLVSGDDYFFRLYNDTTTAGTNVFSIDRDASTVNTVSWCATTDTCDFTVNGFTSIYSDTVNLLELQYSGADADEEKWQFISDINGSLFMRTLSDNEAAGQTFLKATRDTYDLSAVELCSDATCNTLINDALEVTGASTFNDTATYTDGSNFTTINNEIITSDRITGPGTTDGTGVLRGPSLTLTNDSGPVATVAAGVAGASITITDGTNTTAIDENFYSTGSIVANTSGCGAEANLTINWEKVGAFVSMDIPDFSCTSDATTIFIDSSAVFPVALIPTVTGRTVMSMADNAVYSWGTARVDSNGDIILDFENIGANFTNGVTVALSRGVMHYRVN